MLVESTTCECQERAEENSASAGILYSMRDAIATIQQIASSCIKFIKFQHWKVSFQGNDVESNVSTSINDE